MTKIKMWVFGPPEYKGRHRTKLTSYTMGYMIEYYGVPRKRGVARNEV